MSGPGREAQPAAGTPVRQYEPAKNDSGHRDLIGSKNVKTAPFTAVDPGSAADPVHDDPPHPPPGPDPPPKSATEYGRADKGCTAAVIGRWTRLLDRCSGPALGGSVAVRAPPKSWRDAGEEEPGTRRRGKARLKRHRGA